MSSNVHDSSDDLAVNGNLTTAVGSPVVDNKHSHRRCARPHAATRRMPGSAKGSGAFGTFTVTIDITRYTRARIFSEVGNQTEMFARFSVVAAQLGAAEATATSADSR
jgi:hypothetical protein